MDGKKPVTVTIVNKNYPPNAGITGQSANELAEYLIREKGIRVKIIHANADYGATEGGVQPSGELIGVKWIYNGKRKLIRLLASVLESYLMIRKAKTKGEGLLIIMTDPPFLIFWSAILLRKRSWAYWSMDIYPDALRAGGLVSGENWFYKKFHRIVQKNPPSFLLSLGEMQRNFLLRFYKREIPSVTLPCGIVKMNTDSNPVGNPGWYKNNGKIYFGYCGNLGEAHSKEFLLSFMDEIDNEKHVLILAVYGAKAADVLKAAANNPAVIIQKNVSRPDLQLIDIHLVTLMRQWNNICVPSKAFSAVCTGGAILFCGSIDNDNWFYLNKAGWFIDDEKNLKMQISSFITELNRDQITAKKLHAVQLSEEMNRNKIYSFDKIAGFSTN